MSNSKGTKEKCKVCGKRRRGSNHDRGTHHISKMVHTK